MSQVQEQIFQDSQALPSQALAASAAHDYVSQDHAASIAAITDPATVEGEQLEQQQEVEDELALASFVPLEKLQVNGITAADLKKLA